MKKYALVSVFNKTGLQAIVLVLIKWGYTILSTGGTAKQLREWGIEVTEVSAYTGFPEMLDGRVKTLHPKVHGGLLYIRGNPEHEAAAAEHGIGLIDVLIVNLYPFEQTVAKQDCTVEKAIETIDIGGPSMLRSAAKNHESVTVVVDPADYAETEAQLEAGKGTVSPELRVYLARKVFKHTAKYDARIAEYMETHEPELVARAAT